MRKNALAKKVYLVRHGEPEEGYTKRFLGRLDPGLSAEGILQAKRIASRVAALSPSACWTSPLRRASETADIVAQACGLQPVINDLLLEIDFGLLEGLNFEQASALYPGITDSWQALSSDFSFPEGENFTAFNRRVGQLADQVREAPDESPLLVAHGGLLRGLLCSLLDVDASGPQRFRFTYAGLTTVEVYENGLSVLTGFNVG